MISAPGHFEIKVEIYVLIKNALNLAALRLNHLEMSELFQP
jgi:hypothetical protein